VDAAAGVLALSDVLFAVFVFSLHARPELARLTAARLLGDHEVYESGLLAPDDERRVEILTVHVRRMALLIMFVWSFVVGALIGLTRL
jgi:hypothetical protein